MLDAFIVVLGILFTLYLFQVMFCVIILLEGEIYSHRRDFLLRLIPLGPIVISYLELEK